MPLISHFVSPSTTLVASLLYCLPPTSLPAQLPHAASPACLVIIITDLCRLFILSRFLSLDYWIIKMPQQLSLCWKSVIKVDVLE